MINSVSARYPKKQHELTTSKRKVLSNKAFHSKPNNKKPYQRSGWIYKYQRGILEP